MLTTSAIETIRDSQLSSIANRTLLPVQLALIYDNNWFNLWVPSIYGGRESSLPDGLRLLEELAYWDGSLAWTVTLCAGANMFAGYIVPHMAKTIFSDPKVCWGGSGRVGGRAILQEDFYRISGVWQYATGAPHLTHFTVNCEIHDANGPLLDGQGLPIVRSFFVPRELVLIHYDWQTFGLEATASHSFSIENGIVPLANSFSILPEKRHSDTVLYRIPFIPFAETTLCVNYMGMYHRFMDLVEKYFFDKTQSQTWREKHSKSSFRIIDGLRDDFELDKKVFYGLVDQMWSNILQGNEEGNADLYIEIAKCSRVIVATIRQKTALLFPQVGIAGAQAENELNIVFRNIFTATQHSLLNTDISSS